ncbi:galactose oxidase-like domain-containing protein [Edaphobacter modestus]|uniref:galactose oxidase-like domain-containing protein n=1 Tax=Edaphobacter modestus TaxID=388466 RepID=UPI0013EEAC2C|nr:galactose oxidase-like domain-containing protein [Edaphobacter modestus]
MTTSAQATVIVNSSGPPAAGIRATPTSIATGDSSTLTWTTFNCVSADLNGTTVPLNESQVVSPTVTTTYRITCRNSAGATDWGQVTVTVTGGSNPPIIGISANPTSIAPGGSSTVTWTSNGAVSATLNGASVPVNGSQTVSPTATTTYNFIATSSGGTTVSALTTVTVTGAAAVTGQWGPVQTWPFMAAHAHLLPNGSVLFWPSFGNGNNPILWNPVTNSFSTPPKAQFNIFCSGHSFLQDGRLFVAGGHAGIQSDGLISSTVYDPGLNTWTQMSNMNAPRWYPTNTTLPNGDVLVVSGYTTNANYNTLPQIWRPATNTWLGLNSAQLMQPLYPMMFVAPNGKVFAAGPDRITRYLTTSGTGAWTTIGNINYSGTRDYGSAVIFDGKVLIAGGDGHAGPATNTAEMIDLTATNPTWQFTSPMSIARRQLNLTLLPDGRVLASGGSGGFGFDNKNSPVYPTEMWDPATGNWTTMDSISVYRGYHSTALLLPDGRVLSAGGEQTGASAEIYSPPYLFKGARPTITSAPSSVKYGQTFLIGTPNAANITQVTWIRLGSVTHAFDQNQRLNHLQFVQATGGLNITAPANGNLAPPGHYMLFLVNGNGVPSIARIIQITP